MNFYSTVRVLKENIGMQTEDIFDVGQTIVSRFQAVQRRSNITN